MSQSMSEQFDFLRALADEPQVGIALFDLDGVIYFANEAIIRIRGLEYSHDTDASGAKMHDYLPGELADELLGILSPRGGAGTAVRDADRVSRQAASIDVLAIGGVEGVDDHAVRAGRFVDGWF